MTVRPAVWLAAVLVASLDLFTKQWALAELPPGETHALLGDALKLQLVFNSGAAFSLGENYTWVITVIVAFVTAGIVYYARRAKTKTAVVLCGIALGGAVGNLADRLFRDPGFARGHVVDMINYNDVFVGNVADIAIVGSAVVFMALSLFGRKFLVPAGATEQPSDPAADAVASVRSDATP